MGPRITTGRRKDLDELREGTVHNDGHTTRLPWNISRPPDVVVSWIPAAVEKPTPRSPKEVIVSSRWRRLRPSRRPRANVSRGRGRTAVGTPQTSLVTGVPAQRLPPLGAPPQSRRSRPMTSHRTVASRPPGSGVLRTRRASVVALMRPSMLVVMVAIGRFLAAGSPGGPRWTQQPLAEA